MLAKIAIAVAVAAAGLAVVVAMQPARFRIARSAAIAAPAERVFAQVNDLDRWEAWSPWLKGDPEARTAYEGPPAGPGAGLALVGQQERRRGAHDHHGSRPNDLVRLRLDFVRPFSSTSTSGVRLRARRPPDARHVAHVRDKNFLAKAVHMAIDMDKMIGAKFDEGLAQMKAIAEGRAG